MRARNVGLRIYPINPSGFEAHTRYNVRRRRGGPGNDFLRCEIAPGVWRGEATRRARRRSPG